MGIFTPPSHAPPAKYGAKLHAQSNEAGVPQWRVATREVLCPQCREPVLHEVHGARAIWLALLSLRGFREVKNIETTTRWT